MAEMNIALARELRTVRTEFRRLARSFERLAPFLANGHASVAGKSEAPRRRKRDLAPKHRAALRLQGEYMGTMRGLGPRQRARVKKVRVEKGIRVAIVEARRLVD